MSRDHLQPPEDLYEVITISGLQPSPYRGLVLLRNAARLEINAFQEFQRLEDKKDRQLRARFDHWIGGNTHDKYFHGWPNNPNWKDCFVFKWREGRVRHRMYGFLHHPLPCSNGRFRLCTLCTHATKHEHESDPQELGRIVTLSKDGKVLKAISRAFPDQDPKAPKCH